MNDLKRIEGKTIKSINQDSDGKNSYLIIKFEEGGKINITSYPNGDNGVGQLDIAEGDEQSFIGKRIHNVVEEFDGVNDFLVFTFKDSDKLTVTSFCSAEDSTAGLDVTVYSSDNLVAESLEENSYSDARNGQYPMYKPQYEEGDDSLAQEYMDDLEAHLHIQQIYDEGEEQAEIEDWLMLNTEDAPQGVQSKIINLVLQKYDIYPEILEHSEEHILEVEIGIIISPQYRMLFSKVLKKLKKEFITASLDLALSGEARTPVIVVKESTVDDVSDFLYKEIQKGIVYAVDEIK